MIIIIIIIILLLLLGILVCFEKENDTNNAEFKKEQLIGIWDITKDGTGQLDLDETGVRYVFFSNNEIKTKFYNKNSKDYTHLWGNYKIEKGKLNITFPEFIPSLYNFTLKNNDMKLILFDELGNIEFYKNNSLTDSEKKIKHSDYKEEDLIGTWKIESVYSPLFDSSYFDDYNSTWYFYENGTLKVITNHPSFGVDDNTTDWYNYSFTDEGDLIQEFIKGDSIHIQNTEILDFEFSDNKNKFTIYSLMADIYEKVI